MIMICTANMEQEHTVAASQYAIGYIPTSTKYFNRTLQANFNPQ